MVRRHLLFGLIVLAGLSLACNLAGGQSPTSVPTATSTATWTPPPPAGPTEPAASPTATPPAPTVTFEPSATPTSPASPEPTPTETATVAPAPTATLTPAATPVPNTPTSIPPPPTPTATPPAPTVTPLDCTTLPSGSFLTIWESDPALQLSLNCPTSNHPTIVPEAWQVQTSYQPFEHGQMIWSNQIGWYAQPVIYVLFENGTYARYDDTYDPAVDPVSGGEQPPASLFEPILGFGKLWREGAGVRASLGWAAAEETPGSGRFQLFLGGEMVWLSQTGLTTVFEHAGPAVHTFSVPFSQ